MSAPAQIALPGTPGTALQAVWRGLSPEAQAALLDHIEGGTSAEWIARTLTEHGAPIGATSIKTYRRSLKGV